MAAIMINTSAFHVSILPENISSGHFQPWAQCVLMGHARDWVTGNLIPSVSSPDEGFGAGLPGMGAFATTARSKRGYTLGEYPHPPRVYPRLECYPTLGEYPHSPRVYPLLERYPTLGEYPHSPRVYPLSKSYIIPQRYQDIKHRYWPAPIK